MVDREGNWSHYWHDEQKIFLSAVNHILTHGYAKGEAFYKYLLGTNPEEAKRTLESAGDRGARVHEAIRDLIDGREISIDTKYPSEVAKGRFEPLTNGEWDCLRGFAEFVKERRPSLVRREHSVYSLSFRYAGTIDWLGEIDWDGKRVVALLDWKSSGRIYDEYLAQVAAYYQAVLEEHDRGEYAGPLPTHTGIVRFKPTARSGSKYEIKVWNNIETGRHIKAFLSAKDIHEMSQGGDWKPDVEEIPLKIKVAVPAYKEAPKRKSRKSLN